MLGALIAITHRHICLIPPVNATSSILGSITNNLDHFLNGLKTGLKQVGKSLPNFLNQLIEEFPFGIEQLQLGSDFGFFILAHVQL